MPPSGFRKRLRSASPAPTPHKKKKAKKSLFETADAPTQKPKSLEENRKLLQQLDDGDDASSLSEAESDDFEDVPPAKRQKKTHASSSKVKDGNDEDDEMDWEDAIQPGSSTQATPGADKPERDIGDLSISVNEDGSYIEPLVSISTSKKGPSKRERQIRIQSHCLHVQALMWHNTVRNSWLNDVEVQKALVDGLTEGVKREVQRWKEAMGMSSKEELEAKKKAAAAKNKGKGKKATKSKGGRDWNYDAEHAEEGVVNLSGGDPLLRLLKVLTAYWRKRFTVTAPGLRKQGYKPLRRLRDEIKAWEKDRRDFEESGERIESLQDFRKLAKKCEGSRDVGAQLFVALMRALGLEARMVANLQPVGFGWSKAEEADVKKAKKKDGQPEKVEPASESESEVKAPKSNGVGKKSKTPLKKEKPIRKSVRGAKGDPIDLDDSDSPLSSAPSDAEIEEEEDPEDDDLSVIDITPSTPKKKPAKKFDRDNAFPNYWIEVCSPVSHKYIPVDPIVLSTIASNDELLQTFEPRGKKAENAKQVMAYTLGFNADGTAKDVTVRYLKRHQLPGKTKGMRMPVEKVPIYNRNGKVKRHEEYDWFRTLMSIYDRPETKRTAADDLEEQTDLKPLKPSKTEGKEVEKESLQWYKQSAEFVLEQHLRREEALKPGAKSVKSFTAGKGDKAKEHPVFRRDDVLLCKTVESWHKEGRELKMGEQPVKQVAIRAVTLIRKREIEDAQRQTGEKPTQGLYHKLQTDWIVPPPIKDGHIPRNAFGNIDVYVPTMVPKGAVHMPLKGSAKICKKLEIDFAEACTGFEFGKQRAVPVLTGVVIAEENEFLLRDAWKVAREEQKRKEDTKRTTAALHWWRKMLLGLRVLDRMRSEYTGDGDGEDSNPFVLKAKREGRAVNDAVGDEEDDDGGGGFFREGMDVEEVPTRKKNIHVVESDEEPGGGGFLMDANDDGDDDVGGGFLVEEDPDEATNGKSAPGHRAPITPISLQSLHNNNDGDLSGEDDEEDDEIFKPSSKRSAKSGANGKTPAKSKATATANARSSKTRKPAPARSSTKGKRSVPPANGDNESSLSDLPDSDSEGIKATPALNRQRSSPQVVITPGSRGQRRARGAKKTPVRSQYFERTSSDEEDSGEDDNDEEESEESEQEVIRPRATTSRTRTK